MKRALLVLVVVALVFGSVMPALAQSPDETVGTNATISNTDNPPYVKAIWSFNGEDGEPLDESLDPGTQIIPNPGGPIPSDPPGTPVPGQGETTVCVAAVVEDPNGVNDIADVYFKIYHPDGTFKWQVHMTPVDCSAAAAIVNTAAAADLIQYNLTSTPDDGDARYDLEDLLWQLDCNKLQARLWIECWTYEIHQPAGFYRTEVTGVDVGGATGTYQTTGSADHGTEIVSIVQLAVDFDTVNYGAIKPGQWKNIAGNDYFGDGIPTVWNQGNDPASLYVRQTALEGMAPDPGKWITEFDVRLGSDWEFPIAPASYVYPNDPVEGDWSAWHLLSGPLLPCTPTQIEFSVHPALGTPADTYNGLLQFDIVHAVPG